MSSKESHLLALAIVDSIPFTPDAAPTTDILKAVKGKGFDIDLRRLQRHLKWLQEIERYGVVCFKSKPHKWFREGP